MKLLLVTSNRHKTREFGSILSLLHCELVLESQETRDIVECGVTYYQNAYRKTVAGRLLKSAGDSREDVVFADDSGLELPDFGGIPGVRSARFEYQGMPGRIGLVRFLRERGVVSTSARFVCWTVAFLPGVRTCIACCGTVEGTVTVCPRGSGGFGYDPMFIPDGYELTFGEMEPVLKDTISHRAQAMKELWSRIQEGVRLRP